jgi:two-component system, NarL family, sensor histidine kinase EvgS
MKRWKQILLAVFIWPGVTLAVAARPVELTAEDRAWLREHPRILFSYDPDFAPFSYKDQDGRFAGLDADVLTVLANKLGVEFVPVHYANWTEAYRAAEDREVLMLTSTAALPEREGKFAFTRPYVEFPLAILTRTDGENFDNLEKLVGRRVASVRDYAPSLRMRREFPGITSLECASVAEALQAVASGRADAMLTNLVNASYEIRRSGITGLKVAGVAPFTFELRYAVHRSEPALLRVLDEAVASLDERERQALIAPWVKLETGAVVSWRKALRWFLITVAAAGVVLALAGWHNRRLRKELEERLRLQRELEASHRRLEKLNEEKAALIRMAAHDLRNPLGGLLMSIELLRLGAVEKRDATLERMDVLVNQMLHMVRNLLDVQALEAGTRKMEVGRVQVVQVAREALAAHEAAAARKRITLTQEEIDPALAVKADRSALGQITDNLVSNAVKYSPIGATVRVSAVRLEGGRICLSVRDQGPGVKPEEMSRLFDKYTTLSARPTAGEVSTGLGLSIVRELVQLMGGSVWCESKPGEGAVFHVELPEAGPGER